MKDPTEKPRQRAPGAGRKPIDPTGESLVPVNSKVTVGQREKYRALGGSKWLRGQIDAAKVKP